ncbi:uncharacterized protein MELLADRAFT_89486 [Melampsora larici-populina 98AG31]|uniref:F-box domain-containing protein n=1 Tax=Melampsora larici-populina (strain 98AG31 / pathotype 3-4-7) TaxID=747676 RepID=F4RTJ3_MELLP|nr:uncharacterized protein MELLADRAFT_89486 [Melampsora larici-populina 98AG31]EGG04327.1 hypothetical protein MELLADRAFT_89486 [Melampsora larici-populina 98AG31]
MTTPERPLTTPAQYSLPFEITCRIVETYVSQLGSLPHDDQDTASDRTLFYSSTKELLRLRLVSKTWSQATVPFAFHTIRLSTSRSVQSMLKHWSSSIYAPRAQCPVKRLIIEGLAYLQPSDAKDSEKRSKKTMSNIYGRSSESDQAHWWKLTRVEINVYRFFWYFCKFTRGYKANETFKKVEHLRREQAIPSDRGAFRFKLISRSSLCYPQTRIFDDSMDRPRRI